jgi:hypothetical protein
MRSKRPPPPARPHCAGRGSTQAKTLAGLARSGRAAGPPRTPSAAVSPRPRSAAGWSARPWRGRPTRPVPAPRRLPGAGPATQPARRPTSHWRRAAAGADAEPSGSPDVETRYRPRFKDQGRRAQHAAGARMMLGGDPPRRSGPGQEPVQCSNQTDQVAFPQMRHYGRAQAVQTEVRREVWSA